MKITLVLALILFLIIPNDDIKLKELDTIELKRDRIVSVTKKPEIKDIECLAKNIYGEARGEPLKGQLAVAAVTLNRVNSEHYPDTICEVVYQYRQFSWTLKPLFIKEKEAWDRSMKLAKDILHDKIKLEDTRLTHFHTKTIRPRWSLAMSKKEVIGNHVFY